MSENDIFDYSTDELNRLASRKPKYGIEDIANKLHEIILANTSGLRDDDVSITLTGGLDSRVILACLLKAGIRPNCVTYGSPYSIDAIIARSIAESLGLEFQNTCSFQPSKEWYYRWVRETIERDNGCSHLHRAHRTAAIAEHVKQYSPQVLLTGHMGGEGIRGLVYNSYFSSPFFELVNEDRAKPLAAAKEVLHEYFLRSDKVDWSRLMDRISSMSWMTHDRDRNKLFYLYDLIGKIHHAQDIRLYRSYIPRVIPVYLNTGYLEMLFSSPFHFLGKGQGIRGRLSNPAIYCELLRQIFPKLLDFPLSKGYKPREYLRGIWYYVPVKLLRSFRDRRKFAPSFSYGDWYIDFVKEQAESIDPHLWEIYDRKRYMDALYKDSHATVEGYWHKFSNPIFFSMIEQYTTRDSLS